MREPIKFITTEIWETKLGRNIYDEEKKSFWRRNNLDQFPVELIPHIKGEFKQIKKTLESLQNSSICGGIIEDNNCNYRYDDYGRLINLSFSTMHGYSTDIEYTPFGKIVTSINKSNSNTKAPFGTKNFYHYYFDASTKERKEVQLTFTMNKRNIISRDMPVQIVIINDIINSIKIGSLYTLFNEYGHAVQELKPTVSYRTENFYNDYGQRFKSITHEMHEIETGKAGKAWIVRKSTERTFGYDERGNEVFCSLLPFRRYHFEYYRNSLGNRTLHRIRDQGASTVIEFPKY